EIRPVDADRAAGDGVGHQRNDGSFGAVPAQGVIEIEQPHVKRAVLQEVTLGQGPGERHRLTPDTQRRFDTTLGVIGRHSRGAPTWPHWSPPNFGSAQIITLGNANGLTKANTMFAGDEVKHIATFVSLEVVPEAPLGALKRHRDRAVPSPAQL